MRSPMSHLHMLWQLEARALHTSTHLEPLALKLSAMHSRGLLLTLAKDMLEQVQARAACWGDLHVLSVAVDWRLATDPLSCAQPTAAS